MQNIKNIIFDFGGVLYEINTSNSIARFSELSSSPDLFNKENLSKFSRSNLLSSYESGAIISNEFREIFCKEFNIVTTDSQFDDAWNATLISLYPDSIDIVKSFASLKKIFLLSNTSEIHYKKFVIECRSLFSLFEQCFFSFQIKDVKPNISIYKKICSIANIAPEETLFIDDTLANLLPAEKLGFNTFWLEDRTSLYDILKSI